MNHLSNPLPATMSRRRLLGLGGGLAAGVGLAPLLSSCSADDPASATASARPAAP
jgi:peptide/nickel transport system substrate-binding protein